MPQNIISRLFVRYSRKPKSNPKENCEAATAWEKAEHQGGLDIGATRHRKSSCKSSPHGRRGATIRKSNHVLRHIILFFYTDYSEHILFFDINHSEHIILFFYNLNIYVYIGCSTDIYFYFYIRDTNYQHFNTFTNRDVSNYSDFHWPDDGDNDYGYNYYGTKYYHGICYIFVKYFRIVSDSASSTILTTGTGLATTSPSTATTPISGSSSGLISGTASGSTTITSGASSATASGTASGSAAGTPGAGSGTTSGTKTTPPITSGVTKTAPAATSGLYTGAASPTSRSVSEGLLVTISAGIWLLVSLF
ncbi:hypothetical protein TCE0_018r06131 [Talaromyces pinophilus]|uniref:Uncharacterized protein n=1 Tax=Talaromyces pinophilus TaxID=128442 RepID=A0A510NXI3_TALPI|nr:hypothetical protein TCE0_018r06131 [Talaromyces pinophilus]